MAEQGAEQKEEVGEAPNDCCRIGTILFINEKTFKYDKKSKFKLFY